MSNQYKEITTKDLTSYLSLSKGKIMDIRPIEAFNGWRLNDEKRGGHLPGAKSVPYAWTQFIDWVEVLEEKQITKDKPVIIYGYSVEKMNDMAAKLERLGYQNILLYTHFIEEWSADDSLPLDFLARYTQLVYPDWLNSLVRGEKPPHYKGKDYVICHSHYDNYADYLEGHIPGAIAMNSNWLESTKTWNRRSPGELKLALENMGISSDSTVIVYGRYSTPSFETQDFPGQSAGHLGAIRCAAIMLYAGVKDVKILNGGLTSWEMAGYELSGAVVEPDPITDFGAPIPQRPEVFIDTTEAKKYLASDTCELVSVRSWREFIGEYSGYHYIEQKGRIPGAIFGNCGSDAYHMENYRNFDHTMRQVDEVANTWIEGGITPDKKLAFYCGTGWRGSEAFYNAYLMGWPYVAVYDGGWYEWSADPKNLIETGVPFS